MKIIHDEHCRSCGNIVNEECGTWDGYTSCCNKPTAPSGCYDGCSHDEVTILTCAEHSIGNNPSCLECLQRKWEFEQ